MLCSPKGLKSGFHGLTLGLVSVVENYLKGQAAMGLTFFYFRAKIISILWHEVAGARPMSTSEFYF